MDTRETYNVSTGVTRTNEGIPGRENTAASEPVGSSEAPMVEIRHLKKYFHIDRKHDLKAVDDVSFSIAKGETLALVGESGCGKSTLGRTLLGIYNPTDGQIFYHGEDWTSFPASRRVEFARMAQMIFQDPYSSMNPRKTVGDIVAEGLDVHHLVSGKERSQKIRELLEMVGMDESQANRYPHEFSGGQRQRICIARALSLDPEFIVCDEPISALDVSIQAQVVNLLRRLQREKGLTYLFIAHDLNMVRYISNRIAVMYLGHLMEMGPSDDVFFHPAHPYTKMLIDSVPIADSARQYDRKVRRESGEIPSPVNPPEGCVFCTRCPYADEQCRTKRPEMRDMGNGRSVACHKA